MGAKEVRVVASFTCHEGKRKELLPHMRALIEGTNKEEGCLEYQCYQEVNNPLAFTFVERWASREDLDAHIAGPVIKRWFEISNSMRDAGPIIVLKDFE